MAVGTVQLFDNTIENFMDGTTALWEAGNWYAELYMQAGANPTDSWATRSQITHTVCSDGDYAAKDVGSAAVGGTPPQCEFASAIINFGSSVTITAKYLIVLEGDEASPGGTDDLVFWVDLDTTGATAEVSSVSSDFTVDDSANGWFYIAGQA